MKLLRMLVLSAAFRLLAGATTITSGTITITGGFVAISNFDFSGPGFSASGGSGQLGGWDLAIAHPIGTPPGGTVGVSGEAESDDFGGGAATVDGMTFNVDWGTISSSSIFNVVGGPPITLNAGPGTYQTTFTFTGALCGNPSPLNLSCEVNIPNLTGSGVATVTFEAYSTGNLAYTTATYTFVPEPGTWMLVCGGITAVLLLRLQKSRVYLKGPVSCADLQSQL